MKILYVITGLGVGGAERQVVDLAEGFAKNGNVVKICYLTGPCLVSPENPEIELVGLNISKSFSGFLSAYFALKKLVRDFIPDVVHSHMVHANILTRLVRISSPMQRLISTAHSTSEGGRLRMLAYRLTASLAEVITNVSADAVAAFEEKGAVKRGTMLTVGNGIDASKFSPNSAMRIAIRRGESIKEKERVVIAIGRFAEAKDYPNLFIAYKQLLENGAFPQLWIIGDGELREELTSLVIQLKLTNHIRFLGVQKNISEWLNAADVFVLSSRWEGLPLVVGEAMACGKVVVATNAGGVKELLGDCGYLVPPNNSEALCEALQQALSLSDADSSAMGVRSRDRIASEYSLNKAISIWTCLYGAKGT